MKNTDGPVARRRSLRFRLACLSSATLLASCGGDGGGLSSTPSTPVAVRDAQGCVVGTWKAGASNQGTPQYETDHFAFSWTGALVDQNTANDLGALLEGAFAFYASKVGLPAPNCAQQNKTKINIFIADTNYGVEHAGSENGVGAIHLELSALGDNRLTVHELAHVFQSQTRNGPSLSSFILEAHAEFMAAQLPEFHSYTGCVSQQVANPHLFYGSARNRYCSWTFLEHLKDTLGYSAINAIFTGGTTGLSGLDPFDLLMRTRQWSMSQLNDQFASWAVRNIGWDYKDPDGFNRGGVFLDQLPAYQPNIISSATALQVTHLDVLDLANRRFSVPPAWAPQRWGYNLVRLVPDDGATSISVDFRGVTQGSSATNTLVNYANRPIVLPTPDSGWRWTLVAIDASGNPRYSTIMKGGDERLTIDVKPDDQALYMMVMGAPTKFTSIQDEQPYFSIYRYPWMVQMTGAMPFDYQQGANNPFSGHRQDNGGGWVSDYATVDPSAYVGPYAQVLGGTVGPGARIEDHAVVFSGNVTGNARVGGLTVVDGFDVTDNARIASVFSPIGMNFFTLSGIAQLLGDVQTSGDVQQIGAGAFTGFSKGVYYGMVLQSDGLNPAKGALQTDAAPEVTAAPNYIWR